MKDFETNQLKSGNHNFLSANEIFINDLTCEKVALLTVYLRKYEFNVKTMRDIVNPVVIDE